MSYTGTDERDQPRITPAVQALIAINVAVLFLEWTLLGDAVPQTLGFRWGNLEQGRWWTGFTYMFVHGGVWHLAGNMYALWLFGRRLEHVWGTKRFLRFYLFAGLGGLLFHALFIRNGLLLGASAAVYGVMGAYAMQWPRDEVYFFGVIPMRVWTLVLGLVGFDLLMGMLHSSGSDVAYLAHVGGFVVAWFYMRTPNAVSIEQLRQRMAQAPDPAGDEPPRAIPRSAPRQRERLDPADEIVARSKAVVVKRPVAVPAVRPRETTSDELNRVLDKISAQGLDSLTMDERRILEEMSKRLRKP